MHKVHKGDNNIESASEVIGSEDVPLLIFAYISHHLYILISCIGFPALKSEEEKNQAI